MEPVGATGLFHQLDEPLFEDAGTDAAENIVLGLALQHDAVDAAPVKQLRQEQAGRPTAYDYILAVIMILSF
jgi:hypothetical protein